MHMVYRTGIWDRLHPYQLLPGADSPEAMEGFQREELDYTLAFSFYQTFPAWPLPSPRKNIIYANLARHSLALHGGHKLHMGTPSGQIRA